MGIFSNILRNRPQNAGRIAFLAVALSFYVGQAAIAGIAASPCDPEYYKSLQSRAWLEAQREITQNQNLIVKPDSVLEYMCFDKFLGVLANMNSGGAGGILFSETDRWSPRPLPANSMDNALNALVQTAVSQYITGNFSHTFRGGRITGAPAYTTPASATSIAGASFVCNNMRDVWTSAKCSDFVADDASDGFYTFEEYRTAPDRRKYPTVCNNPALYSAPAPGKWTSEFNRATVDASTTWREDDVRTFSNLLDPANCSTALKIETGVVVIRSKANPQVYLEKVCVAPGCRYVPSGSGTVASPSDAGNCTP